jgi:hypothetical protein
MFLNDMGVDPYEWFDNPLDRMPIATDNPRPEEEIADAVNFPPELLEVPTSVTNPKPQPPEKKEEVKTPHHIAYEIATAKYNPFSIGGSESIHDFQGGSENVNR